MWGSTVRNTANSQLVILAALAAATCLATGCILPLPHMRTTWGPIDGHIEEAGSRGPVANAEVEVLYADGGRETTTTKNDGSWSLSAKKRFCWGILVGVALNHSLPYPNCTLARRVDINVSAPGYRPLRLALPSRGSEDDTDPPPSEWPSTPAFSNGRWVLPPIQLTPKPSGQDASSR